MNLLDRIELDLYRAKILSNDEVVEFIEQFNKSCLEHGLDLQTIEFPERK